MQTGSCSWLEIIPASCYESSGFKSLPRILLFLLRFFFVFLIPTKPMLGWFHGLDHVCFTSRHLQIVIQWIRRFFAGVKRSGRDADLWPLSAEVKDEGSCTSTHHIFFHGLARDSFTAYLFSFFFICVTTLWIAQIVQRREMGRSVNSELEWMWKKIIWAVITKVVFNGWVNPRNSGV